MVSSGVTSRVRSVRDKRNTSCRVMMRFPTTHQPALVTAARVRRDGPRRRRTSSNGVELEDPSTFGRCQGIVEINTVDDAAELDTERNAARERTEHVAEVPNALRR